MSTSSTEDAYRLARSSVALPAPPSLCPLRLPAPPSLCPLRLPAPPSLCPLRLPAPPEGVCLSRRIEPHLPLIKSRTLNAFYDALRKGNDPAPHLLALHKEAQQDYRLRRLLAHIIPS